MMWVESLVKGAVASRNSATRAPRRWSLAAFVASTGVPMPIALSASVVRSAAKGTADTARDTISETRLCLSGIGFAGG